MVAHQNAVLATRRPCRYTRVRAWARSTGELPAQARRTRPWTCRAQGRLGLGGGTETALSAISDGCWLAPGAAFTRVHLASSQSGLPESSVATPPPAADSPTGKSSVTLHMGPALPGPASGSAPGSLLRRSSAAFATAWARTGFAPASLLGCVCHRVGPHRVRSCVAPRLRLPPRGPAPGLLLRRSSAAFATAWARTGFAPASLLGCVWLWGLVELRCCDCAVVDLGRGAEKQSDPGESECIKRRA